MEKSPRNLSQSTKGPALDSVLPFGFIKKFLKSIYIVAFISIEYLWKASEKPVTLINSEGEDRSAGGQE